MLAVGRLRRSTISGIEPSGSVGPWAQLIRKTSPTTMQATVLGHSDDEGVPLPGAAGRGEAMARPDRYLEGTFASS
jgi:hypothetical protein